MASTGGNSSGGIFHDTVKAMVCMWAEANGYSYTREDKTYSGLTLNPFRPDVVLTLTREGAEQHKRKTKVFIEVQKDITAEWVQKTIIHYAGKELIIIDLEKLNVDDFIKPMSIEHSIVYLYCHLADQLDNETLLPPKAKPEPRPSEACVYCGKKVKNMPAHIYNHKRKNGPYIEVSV